eukprot:10139669-Heterocapsa_arctica.AAC.1
MYLSEHTDHPFRLLRHRARSNCASRAEWLGLTLLHASGFDPPTFRLEGLRSDQRRHNCVTTA